MHEVPMAELRSFINRLREQYEVPYPLAHQRPFVGDRQLVYEIQEGVGLDAEFCLVAAVSGQYVPTAPSEDYLQRVSWDDGVAVAYRPHDDPDSPVRVDPAPGFSGNRRKAARTPTSWRQRST